LKVVIFAGGRGSRLGTLSKKTPKPLIEISGIPIIIRIIEYYRKFNFSEFIVLTGYLSEQFEILKEKYPNIEIVDTGVDTMTGGRLKRVSDLIQEDFLLTYGDGIANVDITESIGQHKSANKILTITAVHPPSRFGLLNFEGESFSGMSEKNTLPIWVNGGYFVCKPNIFEYIENDADVFEVDVVNRLTKEKSINIYKHTGFWHAIDDTRDKEIVEGLISKNQFDWM
jgi:glucose-1-phosphate cytidylyltransferase